METTCHQTYKNIRVWNLDMFHMDELSHYEGRVSKMLGGAAVLDRSLNRACTTLLVWESTWSHVVLLEEEFQDLQRFKELQRYPMGKNVPKW